jgi:hypothetical protein
MSKKIRFGTVNALTLHQRLLPRGVKLACLALPLTWNTEVIRASRIGRTSPTAYAGAALRLHVNRLDDINLMEDPSP